MNNGVDSCHIVKVSMHQTGIFLEKKIPQSELFTNNLHSGRNDALSFYSLTLSFVHNTRESVSAEIQTPRRWIRESYQTPDLMLSRGEFNQFFSKKFPFYRNQYLHPRKLKVLDGFQTS